MKKISEYKNEEALDLLADIIEPAAAIFSDKNIAELMRGKKKMAAVSAAIKSHKQEVIKILARLNDTPVEEYQCNIFSLPTALLEILNDEGLLGFFTASVRKNTKTSGGNPTENTEESEK
ncbi:MAG: hypothetical protein K2J73_08600 [Oscillospiraceae bacterium]|nr:hypothetical protein [Oscillospiraceae bacterium]